MDILHPLNFAIVGHSLEVKKTNFVIKKITKKIFSLEVYYLSATNALMYLANYT